MPRVHREGPARGPIGVDASALIEEERAAGVAVPAGSEAQVILTAFLGVRITLETWRKPG